jgi:uncharacterized protein with HEPN domain
MSKAIIRLDKILECIENINFIINNKNLKITQNIENKIIKPAIRMNIIKIAEQFAKLKNNNEFKILENFTNEDLRGINSVKNYITHDYDSTDDNIIKDVIKYNLPIFKNTIELIKKEENLRLKK